MIDRNGYLDVRSRSAATFDLDARLPDQVFKKPGGDIMGSVAISANVIAVTGPSGRWGCWGERDPEVAVFRGFPNVAARNEWRAQFGPFLDASGALESYLPLAFAGRTVPDKYAATLTANYGFPGGGRP
ncbi:hypothetical protein [Streptomyces sioyaensis]|uniref:hypothetical protein n=1 Tax=Streptomyces sioyaensis TaxID=67364 RepID=UPI001F20D419|nr:hypothetical protein [Streptomyces sioyaensis]